MAKTPGSRKAKGSRLERKIAEIYRKHGFEGAMRMPMSGAMGGHLSGDISFRFHVPFKVECKNQEKVQLWQWWEQTVRQVGMNQEPVLFISGNHRPMLAVVNAEYLIRLQAIEKELG